MILLYLYLGIRSENTRHRLRHWARLAWFWTAAGVADWLLRVRARAAAKLRRAPKYTGRHTEEALDDDWADYLDQQIIKPEDPAGYLAPIRYHANPAILANANIARGIANQQTADRQARTLGTLVGLTRTITSLCWDERDAPHLAPHDWEYPTGSFRALAGV